MCPVSITCIFFTNLLHWDGVYCLLTLRGWTKSVAMERHYRCALDRSRRAEHLNQAYSFGHTYLIYTATRKDLLWKVSIWT